MQQITISNVSDLFFALLLVAIGLFTIFNARKSTRRAAGHYRSLGLKNHADFHDSWIETLLGILFGVVFMFMGGYLIYQLVNSFLTINVSILTVEVKLEMLYI